jgi:hypothetical protein
MIFALAGNEAEQQGTGFAGKLDALIEIGLSINAC